MLTKRILLKEYEPILLYVTCLALEAFKFVIPGPVRHKLLQFCKPHKETSQMPSFECPIDVQQRESFLGRCLGLIARRRADTRNVKLSKEGLWGQTVLKLNSYKQFALVQLSETAMY